MQVTIRPPRPGDETVLGPLHNHIWSVAYAGLLPTDYLAGRDDDAATGRWQRLIGTPDAEGHDEQGRSVALAEVDGRLAGFCMVGPARDPGLRPRTELMSLYVHPDLHGAGVAQALVEHVLPDGPSYLWVLDGNRRAQGFYRKLGFHRDGASKIHQPSGGVEIRMVRP